MPAHIKASPGDVAKRVVVVGDPKRAEQIAEMLEKPKLVNKNRGFLVYTGEWRGVPVSVAVHGIGAASAAIVFEELNMLGAKVMVRLGTCGAFREDMHIGDYVVVTGAAYMNGGTIGMYLRGEPVSLAAVPDFEVLKSIVDECVAKGVKFFLGPVFSSDAFYAEDPEFAKKWKERGYLAVEMECATLFVLGLMRGFKTGAMLVVSDSLVREEEKELKTAEELKEYVAKAAEIVLNAITRVNP